MTSGTTKNQKEYILVHLYLWVSVVASNAVNNNKAHQKLQRDVMHTYKTT